MTTAQKLMARQLLRLNDRVRNIVLCEEEARELPSEMDFDKGYNHLTKEQRVYLKKKLAPEGSFFMKGKYPKTVRTPPVVIDVRGASEGKWLSASERERAGGCEPICGKPRCC